VEGVSGGVGVWDDRGDHRAMVVEMAALVDMAQNVITYGFGSKKDLGLRSPEFFTSTVVDAGVNVLLGLVTAGAVAGFVGLELPVGLVGAAGLVIGWVISWLWSQANRSLGKVIVGQTGVKLTDWLKRQWAKHIRQAAQDDASIDDLDDWPDTPNGLAP